MNNICDVDIDYIYIKILIKSEFKLFGKTIILHDC